MPPTITTPMQLWTCDRLRGSFQATASDAVLSEHYTFTLTEPCEVYISLRLKRDVMQADAALFIIRVSKKWVANMCLKEGKTHEMTRSCIPHFFFELTSRTMFTSAKQQNSIMIWLNQSPASSTHALLSLNHVIFNLHVKVDGDSDDEPELVASSHSHTHIDPAVRVTLDPGV